MRIGIEFRQIIPGSSGGITPNLVGVLNCLFRLHPEHAYFIYGAFFNYDLFKDAPPAVKRVTLPLAGYFDHLDERLVADHVDILFRAYPIEEFLKFPANRQVFYIPDIQHEEFPEFFQRDVLRTRRAAFHFALSRAGAVGSISNFSISRLKRDPWTRCQDFFLMSPALQFDQQQDRNRPLSAEEANLLPAGDFFYFPANLWPHKNHRRVLQAFELFLKNSGANMEMALTGHPDGWEALRAEFPRLPLRHLGFVSPRLVRELYQRARALVFFTLYEGFGIPLLEAFDAGTPVICSNTTSLPEVGQDAILACDPTDVEAMSHRMAQVHQDEALRQALIERGKGRLAAYTWEQSAENLISACQRVAARASRGETFREERTPLVSIITPSYNQGRFLKRTIESVLNQTYQNIEYIVVDGGSTDESLDILRSYGVRFSWVSEPDKGQANAINKGFARASGEILAFLNSDDVLLPDAVEKAVRAFNEHPDWDMVYGKAQYIDEDDRVTGLYNTDEYSFFRIVDDNCVCQPAAFWQSRIARIVGPFDESLHMALDHDYWLRIDRAGGRIQHLPEILACSRLYAETKTKSARERSYREVFQVSMKHAGFVSKGYHIGLWHHLIWEKYDTRARILRRLPGSFIVVGLLHFYWDRRRSLLPAAVTRLKARLGPSITRRLRPINPLLRGLQDLLPITTPRRPVSGFAPDNWMGPAVQVLVRHKTPGEALYFAGEAAVDTTLTVKVNQRVIGKFPLRRGEYRCFEVDIQVNQRLRLSFSRSMPLNSVRDVAFLVKGTNLFTEGEAFR